MNLNFNLEQVYFKGESILRQNPVYNIIIKKNGKRNVKFDVW